MALKASKAEVWAVSVDDRAGGVAEKLESLAKAGASFEMVFARRTPENPGRGMLFVTPVKSAKVKRAAQEAGMGVPQTIYSVRIEGGDKPGLGSRIARALGEAGISFRGLSGIAIGKKFVSYVACDSAEDQAKAIGVLKKLK
ncbi:MAG TPA: amino acid-binding protein [Burkholderiales bacterium]|nr:amino acid-binding protein [Burkholderiales bacterium]